MKRGNAPQNLGSDLLKMPTLGYHRVMAKRLGEAAKQSRVVKATVAKGQRAQVASRAMSKTKTSVSPSTRQRVSTR